MEKEADQCSQMTAKAEHLSFSQNELRWQLQPKIRLASS